MNLYDYITPNRGEDFTTLLEKENIKVVRIVSSDKLEIKEYSQEEDEFVTEVTHYIHYLIAQDGT